MGLIMEIMAIMEVVQVILVFDYITLLYDTYITYNIFV